MKTSRRGYLMAMVAGSAIIGASTAGVSMAHSQELSRTASQAPVAAPATDPPAGSGSAVDSSPAGDTAASSGTESSTEASSAEPTPSDSTSPATGPSGTASSSPPVDGSSPASGAVPASSDSTSTSNASRGTESAGRSAVSSRSPADRPTTAVTPSSAPTSSAPAPAGSAPAPPSSAPAPAAHQFKDGQYSAAADYNSPGGTQHLGVTVTLAADKVTAAKLDLLGDAGIAHSYQTLFESGYSAQVIGKDIASIKLGVVAGSSLTGQGFNKALDQIEAQARG